MENIEQTPAPAEQSPVVEAPVEETQQQEDAPQDAAPKAKPRRSVRDSLEDAFKKADAQEAKGGKNAEVEKQSNGDTKRVLKAEKLGEEHRRRADDKISGVKEDGTLDQKPAETPERGADGKFVAKDAAEKPAETQGAPKATEAKGKLSEPPSRFSEDAKKAWAEAPESVRAETYRAIRETEQGIQKYQEQFEPIKPFLQMAQNDPRKLAGAMQRYVNTEQLLQQNPAQGFAEIARNMGLSPQQVGKMLMGEDPGQADPRDRQLMAMQQELQQLRQQTGQVTQTMQQQREQAVLSQVEQFAQSHPRFDELSEEIANMLSTGYAKDLQDAYEKADRLNPAPAPAAETPPPPAPPAQTRPARSLTGAPSPGSNPTTTRTPSKSPREALNRAFGV